MSNDKPLKPLTDAEAKAALERLREWKAPTPALEAKLEAAEGARRKLFSERQQAFYREQTRSLNRKERRALRREIGKVERGDYTP